MSVKVNGKIVSIVVIVVALLLFAALSGCVFGGYYVAHRSAEVQFANGGIAIDEAEAVAYAYVEREFAKGGTVTLTQSSTSIYIIPSSFNLRNAYYIYEFEYYISDGNYRVELDIDSRTGEIYKSRQD